jgi:hypothetical protein
LAQDEFETLLKAAEDVSVGGIPFLQTLRILLKHIAEL